MGRLVLQKGFDFELFILEERTDRNKLTNQIMALELDDTINFFGYKINPYPYVREADIFVISSYYSRKFREGALQKVEKNDFG
ncbi:MAG: hypothetical protein ACMUEM_05155 [Flavobacteriales bacterium AspAUS03]